MYNNQSRAIVIDIHRLKSTLGANICKLAFPNYHVQPLISYRNSNKKKSYRNRNNHHGNKSYTIN